MGGHIRIIKNSPKTRERITTKMLRSMAKNFSKVKGTYVENKAVSYIFNVTKKIRYHLL